MSQPHERSSPDDRAVVAASSYVEQISRFARHFGNWPELLGPAGIRAYQLHLVQERWLAACSILVAVAALRFLYRVTLKQNWNIGETVPTCRKPQRLPVVLSRDKVLHFLGDVEMLKDHLFDPARLDIEIKDRRRGGEDQGLHNHRLRL
ncbi:MAG: phage integrase N-terminal SAM-like domain-containing protein [Acetobacteraceae bacterium]